MKPLEPGVPAFQPVTADQIGASLDLPQQPRDVAGIILQVSVNQDQDFPGGGGQAGIHRCALTRVFFKFKDPHTRVAADLLNRPIPRTVIHEEEFMRNTLERQFKFRLKLRDTAFLVEDRNNNGNLGGNHSGKVWYW